MAREITAVPQLTTAERNALTGVPSNTIIENTDSNQFELWNGASWVPVGSSGIPITGNNFSGYMPNGSSWMATGTGPTGLVDGVNTGGNALTTREANGLIVTAAAANVAGITFSPSSITAAYLITAVISVVVSAGTSGTISMTDGTKIIQQRDAGPVNEATPMTLNGLYYPNSVSPVTVKLQIGANPATCEIVSEGAIAPVIEWVVMQIAS